MADDSEQLGQDEIEALLNQAGAGGDSASAASGEGDAAKSSSAQVDQADLDALLQSAAQSPQASSNDAEASHSITQSDLDLLLDKAEQALESIEQPGNETVLPPGIRSFDFQKFGGTSANTESATLELMSDVQLDMTIELGRTHMQLEEVLKLKQGAVVPLDKLAGDPADIYVNGRLVARGEVLVLNDNFCIRVAELIEGDNAVA